MSKHKKTLRQQKTYPSKESSRQRFKFQKHIHKKCFQHANHFSLSCSAGLKNWNVLVCLRYQTNSAFILPRLCGVCGPNDIVKQGIIKYLYWHLVFFHDFKSIGSALSSEVDTFCLVFHMRLTHRHTLSCSSFQTQTQTMAHETLRDAC